MNPDIPSSPSNAPSSGIATDIARRTADAAEATAQTVTAAAKDVSGSTKRMVEDLTDATRDAARHAADTGKRLYHSAALKAEETLATSKDYVRRNPLPAILGAVAFGATIGYLLMASRRKASFGERYADEPLNAVREAILGALAPVAQRVHKGYDSARNGAGKVMDRVHHNLRPARNGNSLSHHIGRIGSNLKFW